MKCPKCNCSVVDKPLLRMNPIGEIGIFWCEDCAKKEEPELYNNLIEDRSDVEKDLINICYPKNLNEEENM